MKSRVAGEPEQAAKQCDDRGGKWFLARRKQKRLRSLKNRHVNFDAKARASPPHGQTLNLLPTKLQRSTDIDTEPTATIMCTRNGKVSIALRLLHKFHRVNRLLALAWHVWTGPYGTYVWPGNCMQITPYSQLSLKRRPSGPKLLSGLERCPL